jgi:fucose permease
MASQVFGSMLDMESGISGPAPVHAKESKSKAPTTVFGATSEPAIALDEMSFEAAYTGPSTNQARKSSTKSTGQTPTSQPQTPAGEFANGQFEIAEEQESTEALQSWRYSVNKWRVLTCCWIYFSNGMSDSAPGALLPYMEAHYHIGYAIVSLIFVAQAIGFLSAAVFTDLLKNRIGLARIFALSEILMVAAFAMIAATPPFPVVVCAFFLLGVAMSINLALSNVYCGSLASSTVICGVAQGAYGIGGTIGPIIATSIVSTGAIWSRYYFIPMATCLIGAIVSVWSFSNYENEHSNQLLSALEREASHQATANPPAVSKWGLLGQALKNKVTIIGALFVFAYQGAEVSISGWVISFLITERQGNPAKVGYVTAGFWGGITLGRFILSPIAARLGERLCVFGLIIAATAFQLLVWLIPNIVGDAIAVALVGFVLGPIAPVYVVVFLRLLPRPIQTIALSFISSAGSSGGAVWPFLTGLIAQSKGTYILHPVCIALFVLMLGCWLVLPKVEKRSE